MNTDKIYLKELKLTNFRQFEELTLPIHPQLTVILGENGGGKTSICDALNKTNSTGELVNSDVKAGAAYCEIECLDIDGTIKNVAKNLTVLRQKSKHRTIALSSFFLYLSIQTIPNFFNQFRNLFINQTNYENQQRLEVDANFRLPNLVKMQNLLIDFFNALGENKYSDLRVKTNLQNLSEYFFPKSEIIQAMQYIQITKNGLSIDIDLLSQGELQLLKLVLNIFVEENRRKNSITDDILTVVIDEIDLHLHPRWQRNLLPALMGVFPEVQFIVTTHSPLIVSNIKAEHIVLLKDYKPYPLKNPTEGRDVNSVLLEVFGISERPKWAAELIEECDNLIEKEQWAEAQKHINLLSQRFGSTDEEVMRLQLAYDFNAPHEHLKG